MNMNIEKLSNFIPSQKKMQYHIFVQRLLEDRFSRQTQSRLATETLKHILKYNV